MICVSFFSYKGGAGRSSIAYNVIPLIAKELRATPDNPVIVVDMDVDSAGMSFLLRRESENVWRESYTTQELLEGYIPGSSDTPEEVALKDHPFFSILNPVGNEFGLEEDRSVLFVSANPGSAIDNYDRAGNPAYKMRRLCEKYKCAALIFDTPAGDQLSARWSLDVSKKIACCMRITYQFRRGTVGYLIRKDKEYEGKKYILVPNAVPQENMVLDGLTYNYEEAKQELLKALGENGKIVNNTIDLKMLQDGYFGVPEVRRFKFQEGIIFKLKDPQPDEEKALSSYKRLASIICDE